MTSEMVRKLKHRFDGAGRTYVAPVCGVKYFAFAAALLTIFAVYPAYSASTDQGNSHLKVTFQARYASMKSAQELHDSKAVASMLAPGFTSVEVDGSVEDAAQMIAELKTLTADPNRKSETTIVSVQCVGDTATVVQRYKMTTVRPPPGGGASSQTVELVATSTDTWTLVQGIWLLDRTATDEIRYEVDGTEVIRKQRVAQY